MEKIKTWIMTKIISKYCLGFIVKGYRALEGKKTGIAIALAVLVWVGEVFGFIPKETAASLYAILAPAGGMAFMEKLKRFQKTAEKVAEAVKKEAAKPKV